MLRTSGLTKRFGGVTAVDDVDFGLADDECCALIGPNGAGKTTFFNLLTGALAPTEGRVEFRVDGDWRDITDFEPHQTASVGLHRSYQITNVFPTATVLENVRVAAQADSDATARFWRNVDAFPEFVAEAEAILDRVGLGGKTETVAQNLSHGEKRQLELGIALAGDPDVLLLDEPAAGVSSESVDDIVDLIRDIAGDHSVLLVEHNMDVVMDLADRIAVLHRGSLIADGEPEAVREDEAVQEAYLGGYDADAEHVAGAEASTGGGSDAGSDSEGGAA
ncbi:ABC transporter ATP-binding protein [Haloarchaeobius amylolyticus]|uniref:ABC transporter ATP-binding protein n=1 Tax=Haloarchaeobius amylolyticus TaxID=1198296 RepID=UPI00227223AD|nr:ABC transporter ATP-binding protein [Haloarchaeobius amylolyticus]